MSTRGVDAPAIALPAPRSRHASALLSRTAPTVREVAACGVLLGALTIAVFLPHVQHSGFVLDDWSNRTAYLWHSPHGPFGWLTGFVDGIGRSRPGSVTYNVLTQGLFGMHMKLYLALAAGLGWLVSVLLYSGLRLARLAPLHAAAIAALVLLFPASDATRLYVGAAFVNLAIALFLGGVLLGIASLRGGAGRPVLLGVLAVVLFALSWSLHETAAVAIVVSVIVLALLSWRRGRQRLAGVYALAVFAAPLVLLARPQQQPQGFSTDVSHAGTLAHQAGTLLARAVVPFGRPSTALVLGVLLAVAAATALAASRMRHGDADRAAIWRWLGLSGASLVVIALAYGSYVPSNPLWYEPLAAGPSNRINALAAIGYVGVVYGVAAAAGTLLMRRRAAGFAWLVPLAVALVVGAGYVHTLRGHARIWERAFAAEERALTVVKGAVPHPAPGTGIYMYGHEASLDYGVPVFRTTWDFNAAVQLTYHDRSLSGYPLVPGTQLVCNAAAMYPNGNGYDRSWAAPYGTQVLVNALSGASQRISDRADCQAAGVRVSAAYR